MTLLLTIDAGNSNTVFGVHAGEELRAHWRLTTRREQTADEYGVLVRNLFGGSGVEPRQIEGVALASVVPPLTPVLVELSREYLHQEPLVVEPGVKTGMPILIDNPKEVGADRIANAVATWDLYGGPSICVDFGTATTCDCVSAKGEYLGGAILPGVGISMDALFGRAAALRRVELVEPRSVIGKSTVESIQSGAVYGFPGAVDAIVRRIEAELGECTVVATGGLSGLMAPLSDTIQHHEPWITLHGLRLIFERNVNK